MQLSFLLPLIKGYSTGSALIIAIGAQNAFVLKQGITRTPTFIVALLCSLIDAMMISISVGGAGHIFLAYPYLIDVAIYGSALFLVAYGIKSFWNAFTKKNFIDINNHRISTSLRTTILTLLAMSFLNPHLYLDTVVLIGSISAQFENESRTFFTIGAVLASFVWFFALAYGAGYLTPIFATPIAWKVLDTLIGIIMFGIAASLTIL